MKYVRWLIPLVLLSVAVPAFAICGACDSYSNCNYQPGLYQGCHYRPLSNCTVLCIETYQPGCGPIGGQAAFSSGYRILSVKVEDAKPVLVKQESVPSPSKKAKSTI